MEDKEIEMEANDIIQEFKRAVERHIDSVVHLGAVVGVLKKACRSDSDYRLVLKALTGKTSSKELTQAQIYALFNFVQPYKPDGGKWQSKRDNLPQMCDALVRNMVDVPEQEKMPLDV